MGAGQDCIGIHPQPDEAGLEPCRDRQQREEQQEKPLERREPVLELPPENHAPARVENVMEQHQHQHAHHDQGPVADRHQPGQRHAARIRDEESNDRQRQAGQADAERNAGLRSWRTGWGGGSRKWISRAHGPRSALWSAGTSAAVPWRARSSARTYAMTAQRSSGLSLSA